MKKKILILLLFITTFVFGFSSIEARECKYTFGGNDITLNFYQVEGTESFDVSYSVQNSNRYDGIYNFVEASLITSNDQCLKSINVCIMRDNSKVTSPLDQDYLGIFGSSLDIETIDDAYANAFNPDNNRWWKYYIIRGSHVNCYTVENTNNDVLKENYISYCDKFEQLYFNITNAYGEYHSCEETKEGKANIARCRSKALTNVNNHIDVLRNTCNTILQNQNLDVGDGCIDSCLKANQLIQTLRENNIKKDDSNNDGECVLSEKLIIWIKNILKWIKYILPVIVIVMGIIDFIKAIGTDKEDEMKKAQGAFVKRLIAAALVFIIPLIIEFILDKMGFGYNDCGLF